MDQYIKISTLNDFIFCPKSIYFHNLYDRYDNQVYHQKSQIEWKINHSSIDNKKYSTSKNILQWIFVYSEKYKLCWKIDLYHIEKKSLLERKTYIEKVYQWYIWQIYWQYFWMKEMWYKVEKLKIYSMKDNKVHEIPLPTKLEIEKFERFLDLYRLFDPNNQYFKQNPNKCKKCIYSELCDVKNFYEDKKKEK